MLACKFPGLKVQIILSKVCVVFFFESSPYILITSAIYVACSPPRGGKPCCLVAVLLYCLMVNLLTSLFEGFERNSLKSWLISASASTEELCSNDCSAKKRFNIGNWKLLF